jgi:plastocyanin
MIVSLLGKIMRKSLLLLSLGIISALQLVRGGDITGTITLKGTPPPEADIGPKMTELSPDCVALYSGKLPTTHFYVVGAGGELADVVVSLKGVPSSSADASAPPVILDQKGCLYAPTILAVQTGQKLIVKNSDPCIHNVHAAPTNNPESNQVQMPGGADLIYTFDKPEPFLKFKCEVHPWMYAWVTVFDHPYFALSGADGKFTIKNVPPGKYTLQAVHRKLGTQTADIEVKADGASQNFAFEVK